MNDEIGFLRFQQTDTDVEPVQLKKYPNPTIRTQVEAPCPGEQSNLFILVSGSTALNGIKRPKNVGSCIFHIAFYDKNGTHIGHVTMQPGEEYDWIKPLSNTHTIKFGCKQNCTGTAILEYDTEYFV